MRLLITKLVTGFCTCILATQVLGVTLVASEYATLVDPRGQASRYKAIVEEAFQRMDQPLEIQVMRLAFVGSSLSSERADGELMFLSLNEKSDRMLYSASYVSANLYLASRRSDVVDVTDFYHIEDARVATENRFANTPELRLVNVVKWSRNPSSFDAFRQLADARAEYLLADELLLTEFNLLLDNAGAPLLEMSREPLVSSTIHISLRKNVPNAAQIIELFDKTIAEMKEDGSYATMLQTAKEGLPDRESLLDHARYKRMIRDW